MTRIYVRVNRYAYEGEDVKFATLDEKEALTADLEDGRALADCQWLYVYEDGMKLVEEWNRSNGKWVTRQYSAETGNWEDGEYGVIVVR